MRTTSPFMQLLCVLGSLLSIALLWASCANDQKPLPKPIEPTVSVDIRGYDLEIVRIRGCEYIYTSGMSPTGQGPAITHAGDCDNPIHQYGWPANAERPQHPEVR